MCTDILQSGRPQTGQGRRNRLCMAAPVNDSSLDRNTILYTIALREQWSGNSLNQASAKLLSYFCVQIVLHNREFAYFALTFVRKWTVNTAKAS